jgi:hypothetical protein
MFVPDKSLGSRFTAASESPGLKLWQVTMGRSPPTRTWQPERTRSNLGRAPVGRNECTALGGLHPAVAGGAGRVASAFRANPSGIGPSLKLAADAGSTWATRTPSAWANFMYAFWPSIFCGPNGMLPSFNNAWTTRVRMARRPMNSSEIWTSNVSSGLVANNVSEPLMSYVF